MTSSGTEESLGADKREKGREEREVPLTMRLSPVALAPACGELHAGSKLPVQYNTITGKYVYHIGMPNVTTLCYIIVLAVLASLYVVVFSLSSFET